MKKFTIKKKIKINATKESVWRVLTTPQLFSQWADAFSPGSKMKGTWKKGGTISYTDQDGMGLKAKILEFKPSANATVEYVDVLGAVKKTDQNGWKGCQETYELIEKNGSTHLSVESEVPTKKFYDLLNKAWGKAILSIKKLAENNSSAISTTRIFVNFPVKDLEKSKTFFKKLGYSFNPQFTDDNAACLIISETSFVMLLDRKFFKTFTKKAVCDSTKQTETIIALSVDSRKEVAKMAKKAVAAGGKIHRQPDDLGWMYLQSFEDLDGHLWEIFWMDTNMVNNVKKDR